MTDNICPKCGKIKHTTFENAQAAIKALKRDGKFVEDMNAYRCGDHFHVGRSPIKMRRRIRQALRGNR